MDFSSIVNEQGYKYIESPVIYKFPSEKFINKKSPFSITTIGNQLFKKQHPNQTNNQKSNLEISSKHHIQNEQQQQKNKIGQGLFDWKYSLNNKNKQFEIHVIPQAKNSTLTNDEPLYSKLTNNNQQKRLSQIQTENIRQNNWQRKPSLQLSYYRKHFSPDTLKSSNIPPLTPFNGTSRYSLPRTSINDELTRYAANQVICQTQKQLLQKQVSNLKFQLKSYEEKVQQLIKQKQEWIRCRNRNQILQREYKILNQEYVRLKDYNLQNLDNKWRSSEVQKIDLKEVSSQDFAKKIMLQKRYSYEIKSSIDESQLKQQVKGLDERILQLESELSLIKRQNSSLREQNKRLINQVALTTKQTLAINNKQPHKLQQQLIYIKEQNIKLQQQKQSYVSNYKILKNERERECKELKSKQQQIYLSLQRLNKDINQIKIEKQSIQDENKKLKRKNTQLESQLEIISKKYTTIKINYEQVNNNLHSTQQLHKIKNRKTTFQDKYLQLQQELKQLQSLNKQKLNQTQKENQEQKQQLVKNYQQKINSLQNQIIQLKGTIRQHLHDIKNYQKDTKNYQKEIHQNNQKIQKYQTKIKQLQQKLNINDSKIKDYDSKMKDYESKMKRNEKQYQQKLSKLEQTFTSNQGKTSRSQQKLKSQQNTIKNIQEKTTKLETLLQNKQKQLSQKQNELQSMVQKREQKWKQLMDVKQKYMELSETILVHSNEKDLLKSQNFTLREKFTQKQTQLTLLKKQFQSQTNHLNNFIATFQQKQTEIVTANRNTLIMKENELKKQRVQIEGLLQQIVKLREVKNQNYKLMQKIKQFMKLDETITHLWAVKQTEYQNIAQILTYINVQKTNN